MNNVFEIQTWIDKFKGDQLNVDKLKEYLEFVQKAEQTRDPERYSEWHHVVPKCIDKDKRYIDEVVHINGADHFRAHMKLVECFVESSYFRRLLVYPLNRMSKESRLGDLSPEEYEKSRTLFSNSQKGENNPAKRSEVKVKISNSRVGKVHITNGTEERLVDTDYPLPEGWYYGQSDSHNLNSGLAQIGRKFLEESKILMSKSRSEGNKGRRWITNGVVNSFIKENEEIPEGWRLGRTVSQETKDKVREISTGRVLINDGIKSVFINKTDEIPEGFSVGGLKASTKGKIRITNGVSNRCIKETDPIPQGWWRGMIHYKNKEN